MIRLYNLYLPSRLFTFIAIDGLILLAVAAVTMRMRLSALSAM